MYVYRHQDRRIHLKLRWNTQMWQRFDWKHWNVNVELLEIVDNPLLPGCRILPLLHPICCDYAAISLVPLSVLRVGVGGDLSRVMG